MKIRTTRKTFVLEERPVKTNTLSIPNDKEWSKVYNIIKTTGSMKEGVKYYDGYAKVRMESNKVENSTSEKISSFAIDYDLNPHFQLVEVPQYSLEDISGIRHVIGSKVPSKVPFFTEREELRGLLLSISDFVCRFGIRDLTLAGDDLDQNIINFLTHFPVKLNLTVIKSIENIKVSAVPFENVVMIVRKRTSVVPWLTKVNPKKFLVILPIGKYKFPESDAIVIPWNVSMISMCSPWGIKGSKDYIIDSSNFTHNYRTYFNGNWDTRVTVAKTDHCYNCALEYEIIDRCSRYSEKKISRTTFIL